MFSFRARAEKGIARHIDASGVVGTQYFWLVRSEHAHTSYPGLPGLILVPRGRAPFGQHQESRPLAQSNDIPFLNGFVKTIRLRPEPIKFVRLDSEHAQNDGNSVNRGLPVLDMTRGHDSWCWPKGARPLGTRMSLDSSFARPGSAPIWGGKKGEFQGLDYNSHWVPVPNHTRAMILFCFLFRSFSFFLLYTRNQLSRAVFPSEENDRSN